MRNLSFYPLFFIFLFFYCFQANAQALKTYSGKFKGGQATYTYRDNPEGGRIYEGKFSYTYLAFRINGNYKNDKKDGLWSYKTDKGELKVHYTEGMLNGSYQFEGVAPTLYARLSASLTLKNNKLVGAVKASGFISPRWDMGSLTGQFDENGYADGIWIYDTTPYEGIKIYRATYKNGYLLKSSVEDTTTGDISSKSVDFAFLARSIVINMKENLEYLIDRGWIAFESYEITKQGTPPAENETPESESDKILEVAEVMPQFPGGQSELMAYLAKNIKYPATAQENGTQGRVIVEFVVKSDGSISDVQVARSVDPALDQEAIRLIEAMPKWIPGRQNGQNVNVKYTLPILFKL